MTLTSRYSCAKRVVLIGSSGGGTATLGHNNVSEFVKLISDNLNRIGGGDDDDELVVTVNLDTVLFVSLDNGGGLDSVTGEEDATLLCIQDSGSKEVIFHNSLDQINNMMKKYDESVAIDIQEGKVHGLITVSCDPSTLSRTFQAAAKHNVPITGTGGTSLSMATSKFKLRLIGNAGGSVGTTPETKAISFASAFSEEWDLKYCPWEATTTKAANAPSWKSVLNSCLPGFWSIVLLKRIILTTPVGECIPEHERKALIFMIESYSLPILCAVIMATSRRKVESVQMSAVLAASACRKTILGGLISGWCVSILEVRLLYICILKWKLPATMTNLLRVFVGILTAVIMIPISPYLSQITEQYRHITLTYLWESTGSSSVVHGYIRLLASSFLGCLFCYGSKIGWYHSIFLPIILVEMEIGDASMLGALDFLTLVLVSAGICLGIILTGSTEERSLARRGIATNLLCGDFIEVCYPHMEQHYLVNISGYVASSVSVAVLTGGCRSSAYMPFPVAIWLANDQKQFLIASTIAFLIPFIATISNYYFFVRKRKTD
ncbi:hypothetical protein FRACYDRAFT_228753 [Fragilariopsis cylindrus CCMP1102]|uniref:Uncharacterized protein n=1 Tax=Fragilariopsis cylindrus CCMP1102 TaxID=635003 RepID=A0A1E7EUU6_9STRA|nr:hypothetical protein FRACYDRAFT_228753 [Fragilariopsis cylindrus CCMP1102]|eukprot:OEU09574.1 hypothetical protein FRACYDRAFT_228753 [Fragilariopsis cylindrus CCMP1102]